MRSEFHIKKCIWLLLAFLYFSGPGLKAKSAGYVVIGYVGGYDGLINTDGIDAVKLTHINYAFVDIKDGKAWLHNEITDTINFRKLNQLKKLNPNLKILISIGGWSWSENFSDAVLTDASRKLFASSAADIVSKYNLDGVDIDWEYPAMPGEPDNIYRPEDKQNYTLMFSELRNTLNRLEQQTQKKYLLTTAVGRSSSFIAHTEMQSVQQYLDYVNIMTYDYKTEEDSIVGHHTNLFSSGTQNPSSADRSVRECLAAGVPSNKIVLGIAFYGHGWNMENDDNHGLDRKAVSPADVGGYSAIKDSIMSQHGYTRYWDKKAKAPYIFNSKKMLFISYDDEESVKYKCKYVKKHQLAGVMFWEYFADPKEYLLNEIALQLE